MVPPPEGGFGPFGDGPHPGIHLLGRIRKKADMRFA